MSFERWDPSFLAHYDDYEGGAADHIRACYAEIDALEAKLAETEKSRNDWMAQYKTYRANTEAKLASLAPSQEVGELVRALTELKRSVEAADPDYVKYKTPAMQAALEQAAATLSAHCSLKEARREG